MAYAKPALRVAEIRKEADKRRITLTAWESNFLSSVTNRDTISIAQEEALVKIERKVFDVQSDEDEDEDRLGSVDRKWDRHLY